MISGKVSTSGEQVEPSAADVNTIKGWMTLEHIKTTFNVPLADLLKQVYLPADTPPTTAIKDLETGLFSVTSLRTWLQNHTQSADVPPTNSTMPTPTPTQITLSTPSA